MPIFVKKRLANIPSETVSKSIPSESLKFLNQCRQHVGKFLHKFLREKYVELFKKPLPKEIAWDLVKVCIGYHLQIRDYQAAGKPIPPKMQSNYEAALKFNRSGLSPILQVQLEEDYSRKHQGAVENHIKEKEEEMGKVKVVKKGKVAKEKGPTIDDTWVHILSAATGKRFTDKAIAVNMMSACPGHKYTEASVAAHRSGYNNGRFSCQKGVKPKTRLEKYEAK